MNLGPFDEQVLQCRKKEWGTLRDFTTPVLQQNTGKIEGGHFEKKNPESLAMPKKSETEDPWASSGIVIYAENIIRFCSWGQRVQICVFLKVCRTFGVELFWSFQVYRKK